MPWLLSQFTSDQREINWVPVDDGGNEVEFKGSYSSDDDLASSILPMRFKQITKHKSIPDFVAGYHDSLFVSLRMKILIEQHDPVKHHFYPIVLDTYSDGLITDQYFIFRFGNYIEHGVIEEKSKVFPSHHPDGTLAMYSTPAYPKITWKAPKIAGRSVWTDSGLRRRFFVSDNFMTMLKQEKIGVFKATESFEE